MMELTTCAFIVTLVSLVTATPYGYGVKGGAGASARAYSSASAGAFGGNGFSESFSKSSSSSSSSASASSSSSSFSYSGSGAGGFSSQGTNGNGGCTTGACQSSGANEISATHGTNGAGVGLHGYNAANAAAGSSATPGAECHGPTCENNSGKCSSGQCQSSPKPGPSTPGHDSNNKCTSGQCEPTSPTGPSSSQYDDSDDIRFIAHDSKDQSSNQDKTRGHIASSDCRGGSCGSSRPFDSQPNFPHGSTNSYQNSNPSQSTNLNSGSTPGYHSLSTDLEAPKQDSNCNSGNCNPGSSEPVHGSSPSSYNVPIHGAYDSAKQKPICADGNCDNAQKGIYSSTTSTSLSNNYLSPHDSAKGPTHGYPTATSCGGLNCGSVPSSQISGRPSAIGSTDIHSGLPSSNGAALNPTSCNSPNCSPHYAGSFPTGPNVQPGHTGISGPADKVKPSNDNLPVYTGGFGAPAGIFKPNEYDIPATGPSSPGHKHPSTTAPSQTPFGSSPTGCNSPNCFNQGPSSGINAQSNPFGSHTPSGEVNTSGQKLPTYTGGFGGPAGMLKPNEFSIPSSVPSKPINSASQTYNTPPSSSCSTPNCIGSSPVPGVSSAASAQSGSYGSHHQSGGGPGSGNNSPTYTGGFGGPAGMLKPNEFDIKVTNTPIHSANPSYNSQTPSTSPAGGCKTPNCNAYAPIAGATAGANAQSGSYGTYQQSGGVTGSIHNVPTYTGGFGGPAGMLESDEFDIKVTNKPTHSTNPSYNSQPSISSPAAGCKTPNCNAYSPIAGAGAGAHAQSGAYGANKPSTGVDSSTELPPYVGGFGGPVGVLKPNEISVPSYSGISPNKAPTGANLAGCTTPNCYPSSVSDTIETTSQPSFGVTKPSSVPHHSTVTSPGYISNFDRPVGIANPIAHAVAPIAPGYANAQPLRPTGTYSSGCKTPNCAAYPTVGLPADVNAPSGSFGVTNPSSEAKPSGPQYSGNFGGPSTTPSNHPYNGPSTGSASTNCKTSNCANLPSASAGANAQSGSYADSKHQQMPAYTGGFGAPSGFLKPNDYSIPALSTSSNYHIPTGVSTPASCSSGNCNPKVTSPSPTGPNAASSGVHASATSVASANAVAYSGGFGGPPGFLKPYDDGKVDITKLDTGLNQGSQSSSENIHSQHGTKPGTLGNGASFNAGTAGQVGSQSHIGALAGSAAGATTNSGALASAKSGSYGSHTHSAHQAGNGVKGASPCGGGCGGGYQDGLNGNSAAAAARSLSSSGAFGIGGSFASSSASAHSSAGSYTKGGYGKR